MKRNPSVIFEISHFLKIDLQQMALANVFKQNLS